MTATTTSGPLSAIARKIGSYWWALLVVGIAWIVLGFVVLRFDATTPAVIAIVFGVLLLFATAGEIFRAAVTVGGWRVWHVIFAVLLLGAAIIAFVDPAGTFLSLALVTGFYFVFAGVYDIISSLFTVSLNPTWWLQLLSGIGQLILGLLASGSLSNSVVVLVTYVSVMAVFRGVSEIAAAFTVRNLKPSAA
jgi:uncharacterized membrane protein HdeD (DUF308 family)